ncbi:MAG: hypothetical protein Q8L29_02550 [archaeon]|nr:hypothetical protein [archaeon]
MLKYLELTKSGLYNLLRTGIESTPREATGQLYGGEQRNGSLIIHNSYPLQTATRKPTEVSYGNGEAVKRLKRLDEATGDYLIGGFHTHIKNDGEEKPCLKLSSSDIEFIETDMDNFKISNWVEIILRLKSLNFQYPQKTNILIKENPKKLIARIVDSPNHGYQAILCAYSLIRENGKTKISELKVKRRR